jgi:serine/threonine protein kinase
VLTVDRNLAELSLISEALEVFEDGPSRTNSTENAGLTRNLSTDSARGVNRSNHVLTLYDAFANPKSGLINLVVEYMDGGSLADLVQCGGCQDETVIADIATQVLKGLYFLHSKLQIHVR